MASIWEEFDKPVASDPVAGKGMWAEFDAKEPGDFTRGAKVAFGQTAPLAKGLIGAVGAAGEQAFGEGGISTAIKDWGIKGYQDGMAKLAPLQHENDDITTAWDKAKQGDIGALFDWAAYAMGYGAVQVGEAALTGGAGALLGKGVASTVAKTAVENMVERQAAKIAATEMGAKLGADELTKAATEQVARKISALGAGTALQGYNEMMEVGSIYPDAVEQAKKEGRELTGSDLARVWGLGTLSAATESATDLLGIGAVMGKFKNVGPSGRLARGAIGGAAGTMIEGGQEGTQTVLERIGAGQEVFSPEGVRDIVNSAAMGALPGGLIGSVSGIAYKPQQAAQPEVQPAPVREAIANQALDRIGTAQNVDQAIQAAQESVNANPATASVHDELIDRARWEDQRDAAWADTEQAQTWRGIIGETLKNIDMERGFSASEEARSIGNEIARARQTEDQAAQNRDELAAAVQSGQGQGIIGLKLREALGLPETQNAETVRSDQGQNGEGRPGGLPGVQPGAVEGGGDLQQPAPQPANVGSAPGGSEAPGPGGLENAVTPREVQRTAEEAVAEQQNRETRAGLVQPAQQAPQAALPAPAAQAQPEAAAPAAAPAVQPQAAPEVKFLGKPMEALTARELNVAVKRGKAAEVQHAAQAEIDRRQVARQERAQQVFKQRSQVAPERDSMFAAIAKLGGLDRHEAIGTWGLDTKDAGLKTPVWGKPLLKTGGQSLDAMAEALHELGYLKDRDLREFEARFDEERRGQAVYTPKGEEHRSAQEQADQQDVARQTAEQQEVDTLGLTPEDLAETGFDAMPEEEQADVQTIVDQLLEYARGKPYEELIDAILERAAIQSEGQGVSAYVRAVVAQTREVLHAQNPVNESAQAPGGENRQGGEGDHAQAGGEGRRAGAEAHGQEVNGQGAQVPSAKVGEQPVAERPIPSGAAPEERGNTGDARQAAAPSERPALDLAAQTPADLAAKAQQEAAVAMKEAADALKATADDMRAGFALTGSSRPADEAAARGQQGLLEAPAAAKPERPTGNTDATLARFRPREMVIFAKPYVGKTGAKLLGYEWKWRMEEGVDKRGEDRSMRVSDWEESITNPATNREIVHQFQVEATDGTVELVSAETAAKVLGVSDSTVRSSAKRLLEEEMRKQRQHELDRTAAEMPAIRAAFDHFFQTVESKETPRGRMLFSRAPTFTPDPEGLPLLGGEVSALVDPVFMREGSNGSAVYQHTIAAGERTLGIVTLGWQGDKVSDLYFIYTEPGKRRLGVAEDVIRSILTHNGEAELHVSLILNQARPFWRNMGTEFVQTDEGTDGFLTQDRYLAEKGRREAALAGNARGGQTALGEGEGGPGTPQAGEKPAQLSRRPGGKMRAAEVRQAISGIAERLKALPPVEVVQSEADVPGLENVPPGNPIEGAFVDGRVYLVADSLANAKRAREVLAHEAVGHMAIEDMLDAAQPGLSAKLARQVQTLDKAGNAYIKRLGAIVDDRQPGLAPEDRAFEIVAMIAERGDQNADPVARSMAQRVIDAMKAFFKLVFDLDLNDQDVRDIVGLAERWAQGEEHVQQMVGGKLEGVKLARGDDLSAREEQLRRQILDMEDDIAQRTKDINAMRQTARRNPKYRQGKYAQELAQSEKDEATAQRDLARTRAEHARVAKDLERLPAVENPRNQLPLFSRGDQTQTPAFKRWFGESKVVDKDGKPLVVYHGTTADFAEFDTQRPRAKAENPAWSGDLGAWFAGESKYQGNYDEGNAEYQAESYTEKRGSMEYRTGANVRPVYLSIKNPKEFEGWEDFADYRLENFKGKPAADMRAALTASGHDGIVIRNSMTDGNVDRDDWVAFHPEQIKSIFNIGTFNPQNPDIRFSRAPLGALTADQESALRNVHGDPVTWRTKLQEFRADWQKNLVQGLFDQFAPIADYSKSAYIKARATKGGESTLEALLVYGKVYVDKDGAYKVDYSKANGLNGFAKVIAGLHGEHDRFLEWVAAQRAERLKGLGLENLYSDTDIAALKTLNQGTMKDGGSRASAYAKALAQLNEWNDSVLKIASDSGLIDDATRQMYKDVPYVPFYRLQEEGAVSGFGMKAGLVNQYAWKKLKGGTAHLNDDLLANLLQNWSHLITASAKNRAAKAALEAAVAAKVATEIPAGAPGKGHVSFSEAGKDRVFTVSDPHLMDAIAAMNYAGLGSVGKPFITMKRWLTIGVTVNPAFKIRNLIRDSIQAIGTSGLSYNPGKNITQGFKATELASETRAQLLAGGGMIRFGSMLDGNNADRTRRLIEENVNPDYILDNASKLERFWKTRIMPAFDAYQEIGDRGEQISRAALYEQMTAKGMSHEEAAFWARDLMDFSMSGKWGAVRILTQTVPFMNARLQGIYKLGRATKADYRRMAITLGAVGLASIALMLAYGDDDDWKKREDWDRDNYWWFKIGGIAFRIPKPFEIGAVGTLAERSVELMVSDEMTGKRFRERISATVFNQLNMNPTPQLVKPLMDIYANKDAFTGRPIETQGMENLRKQDRSTEHTSEVAKFLGGLGLPDPTQLAMGQWNTLSPVQIDSLVRGYFGWLGSSTTTALDWGIRLMMNRGERPDMKLRDVFLVGGFAETLPSGSSRYVTQLYDQAKEIEEAYGSYRDALKRGDKERAQSILEDERDKIHKHRAVEALKRRESAFNAQAKMIEASKTMSGEEKRRRLDAIQQRKSDLARALH